ncbi:MAG: hypothetical protein DMF85_01580 [Acidobacteria bacterium]|nr:MAG: hypothetical protein DMF85_01580 [Acidobacteriota bacterium]
MIFAAPATVRAQHGNSSHGSSSTHGSSTHTTKPPHGASTHKTSGTTTTKSPTSKTSTTTASTTTAGSTTTLNAVQQKLQKNTNLASKLKTRLGGIDLMTAADGKWRNFGQFVSAVNVSYNLRIKFDDLKTKLLTDGMSLGQAIQALRPSVDGSAEATHAETQADDMIRKTTTSTSTKTAQKKPVKPHHTGE